MTNLPYRRTVQFSAAFAAWMLGVASLYAAPPTGDDSPTSQQVRTSNRPVSPDLSALDADHPLLPVITYARKEQEYLRRTVRDFTCRLVKRERINGILQDHQYIDMWVREASHAAQPAGIPFSIYMRFLAPRKVAGRRVLYVDSRNNGRMLVRNGGKHFDYVVVDLDPYGETAMDESLVPVTQCGFNQILAQMIAVLERHAAADAPGGNTRVEQITGAKLNSRPCHVIRITHADNAPGLEFHQANVFVDDELHIPVRVDYSSWPRHSDSSPPLIAEYTYTNLRINLGLVDSHFSPGLVRGRATQ